MTTMYKTPTENLIDALRKTAADTRDYSSHSVVRDPLAHAFEFLAEELSKLIKAPSSGRPPPHPPLWETKSPSFRTNDRPPTTPQLLELYEAEKLAMKGPPTPETLQRIAEHIRLAVRITTGRQFINPLTEKRSTK